MPIENIPFYIHKANDKRRGKEFLGILKESLEQWKSSEGVNFSQGELFSSRNQSFVFTVSHLQRISTEDGLGRKNIYRTVNHSKKLLHFEAIQAFVGSGEIRQLQQPNVLEDIPHGHPNPEPRGALVDKDAFQNLPKVGATNRQTVPSLLALPPRFNQPNIAIIEVNATGDADIGGTNIEGFIQLGMLAIPAIRGNRVAASLPQPNQIFVQVTIKMDTSHPLLKALNIPPVKTFITPFNIDPNNGVVREKTERVDFDNEAYGNIKQRIVRSNIELINIVKDPGVEIMGTVSRVEISNIPGASIALGPISMPTQPQFLTRAVSGATIGVNPKFFHRDFHLRDYGQDFAEAMIHEVGHAYGRGENFVLSTRPDGTEVITGQYGTNVIDFMDSIVSPSATGFFNDPRPFGSIASMFPTLPINATAADVVNISPNQMNLAAARIAFTNAENRNNWEWLNNDPNAP